jgi:hypothetical protein
MLRNLVIAAFTVSFGLLGCSKSPTATPDQPATLTPVELPTDHPVLTQLPDPEANGGHAGRAPRRISVPQLKASIATITNGTRQWSQIDNLASSLGQADFALTVSDATEPNLVFAKFLDDGAREVCLNVARDDLARAQDARLLWPDVPGTSRDFTTLDDATIQANLMTLSVKFWGSPLDTSELSDWTASFKKLATRAKTVNKPEQAWGSICVAMMTDPRFITY